MNNSNTNTSKVLLIILGVLVAIVIGFSSKATGSTSDFVNWNGNTDTNIEQKVSDVFNKSISKFSTSINDYFTAL